MKLINYLKSFFTTASLTDKRTISLIVKDNLYALVDTKTGNLLDFFDNNLDTFDDIKDKNENNPYGIGASTIEYVKGKLSYKKTLSIFVDHNLCVVVDTKTEDILHVFDTKLDVYDNIKDAYKAYPKASKKWKVISYDIEERLDCI